MAARKLVIILITALVPIMVTAQNTGYAGKKFILKTDLLYGKKIGVTLLEAEYTFLPNFSFTLGFGAHQGLYKQSLRPKDVRYIAQEVYGAYWYVDGKKYGNFPDALIKSKTMRCMLKAYLGRVSPKAPRGWYFGFQYETGSATLENGVSLTPVTSGNNNHINFIVKNNVVVENIAVRMKEFSFGKQQIFAEKFVTDVNVGFNWSKFNSNGSRETLNITTLSAAYFGPNLFVKGKSSSSDDSPGPYTKTFGMSFYFKLGYLIF